MIISNVLCIVFEIIVNRNHLLEGYVSRMMEKWWCLYPLWRGSVWTGYSSTEGTSGGGQAASWTLVRQIFIAVREWGENSKCYKFSDQPRSSQGFPGAETVKSACNVGDRGSIPGEGNDNLLQYSCLENPMGGGAWGATVHRVAKSQTGLNDFTLGVCKLRRALTCLWSHCEEQLTEECSQGFFLSLIFFISWQETFP